MRLQAPACFLCLWNWSFFKLPVLFASLLKAVWGESVKLGSSPLMKCPNVNIWHDSTRGVFLISLLLTSYIMSCENTWTVESENTRGYFFFFTIHKTWDFFQLSSNKSTNIIIQIYLNLKYIMSLPEITFLTFLLYVCSNGKACDRRTVVLKRMHDSSFER